MKQSSLLAIAVCAYSMVALEAFSSSVHKRPPSQSSRWKLPRKAKTPPIKVNITSLAQLEKHWQDPQGLFRDDKGHIEYDSLLRAAQVKGDTQRIGSVDLRNYTHPVVQLLHHRRKNPDSRDNFKLALAIEGGGMRGCVSAGMVCALHHLNLSSVVDVVYGSSAGTVVGSYMITGQLPWFGPEVYYDKLTTAGRKFIDTRRLMRAVGLGLLDPRLIKDVMTSRHGKPVLNLSYLLQSTLQETKPLDWNKFVQRQKVQPLKVIVSGLKSEKSIVLDMNNGAFDSLSELAECMHASCLLPGIAGPVMNYNTQPTKSQPKFVLANGYDHPDYEPLVDALVYEPIPYRSALQEGATHVIAIRSRPDGVDITGKGSFFERLIFRRFFLRKNRLPHIYQRLKQQLHKKLYAEDVIRLNEEAYTQRDYTDTSAPHIMTVACPPGSAEVTRLETGRVAIFEGLRRGFARAYDCLVEDPQERGKGMEIAKHYFPDEILDYDPVTIDETLESAFAVYMRNNGVSPKVWNAINKANDL
jgi:predicted acylesterase/phospholipase RssA